MVSFRHVALAWATMAVCISAHPVAAQSASVGDPAKVRAAYEIAQKCLAADGFAYNDRKDANDQPRMQYYADKTKIAFAAVARLSKQLGQSDDQFHADEEHWIYQELPKLKDAQYFQATADLCTAYGLM